MIVVFLGPSMPLDQARSLLEADYRPPVRRGDLERLAPGTLVAMIDGVFDQSLAVSPREVHDAVARGVQIVGGSSMGALRAAEVAGVQGVGLVFQWYRDGVIERDDEVALLFDEHLGRALTVPLVNVRFAVERMCRPGTIDRRLGEQLIAAAIALPYQERQYRTILQRAGVGERADSADLIAMLASWDLKREDAQVVLETVEELARRRRASGRAEAGLHVVTGPADGEAPPAGPGGREAADAAAQVRIWESGDEVTFAELVEFLGTTGKLEAAGRAAIARFVLEGNPLQLPDEVQVTSADAQAVLNRAAGRWGWVSAEEARVTLGDLRLELAELGEHCKEESAAVQVVQAMIRARSPAFLHALAAELFFDDLALKREVMRLGALRYFAGLESTPPTVRELGEAEQVLCKLHGVLEPSRLHRTWQQLGLTGASVDPAERGGQGSPVASGAPGLVVQLALARRAGRRLAALMRGAASAPSPASAAPDALVHASDVLALGPSPKPPGEARFSLTLAEASTHVEALRRAIGVTRIGMIGELADLGGVQIAQASRPTNAWSSTYGSGKSMSKEGAIIGSVLEETEKWAQEQFAPSSDELLYGSFQALREHHAVVDPATLDLPYDTSYRSELRLAWYRASELISGRGVYLPLDVLQLRRSKGDICFTRRGARKHLATNGLGSGFSREEAILHAVCEFVERHAMRLAELYLSNPGGLGTVPYAFLDLDAGLGATSSRLGPLVRLLRGTGATVRVLDVTSEIRIPTFLATIIQDHQRADGHAAHPNPEVAIEMALLEAAQTISCEVAGGREDLSIRARSLGRHERPRPNTIPGLWSWLDPDLVGEPLDEVEGLRSADLYEDLRWCLDRISQAGISQVVAVDLTVPAIRPAHVVRVTIPGLESNNPFYTGPRARLALLRDLLPRWR